MTTERMLVIAKARWVFHCERARCDHKQRRTLKIDRHDRQIERRNENDEKTSEQKNRQQQEAAETTESRKESSRSSESSRITTEQKQKQKQKQNKGEEKQEEHSALDSHFKKNKLQDRKFGVYSTDFDQIPDTSVCVCVCVCVCECVSV